MRTYESLLVLISLYAFEWVLMCPFRFLFVVMDFNGSLLVLISRNATL